MFIVNPRFTISFSIVGTPRFDDPRLYDYKAKWTFIPLSFLTLAVANLTDGLVSFFLLFIDLLLYDR